VILVLLLLSTCIAFLLLPAPVPVPTTNIDSFELSCNEPVALNLPKNAEPPVVVDECEPETDKLLPNITVDTKLAFDDDT
jgi:hypothetical protein